MMRAAVYRSFGGPIRIEQLPQPSVPSDGLVIHVKATGVCRSDWHGWKGHDGDIRQHGLPFVPGHEVSGQVVQVGEDLARRKLFSVGDRVAVPFILSCGLCEECHDGRPTVCSDQSQPGFTMNGSFAEYLAIPRAGRNVSRIPPGVSYVQAASLGCRFTTAYRAVVQQGEIRSSIDTVAVFGCGGLGLSCIMIARCYGAKRIIGVDVSEAALQKARQVGADEVVLVRRDDNESGRAQVMELTDGKGADLTLDAAGFSSTCENAVYCCRRSGRMIQVGLPFSGNDEKGPQIPMSFVAGREVVMKGSHGFAASDLPMILQLVAKGRLQPELLVERQVTLEEGIETLQGMDRGSPLGMTVITSFGDTDIAMRNSKL